MVYLLNLPITFCSYKKLAIFKTQNSLPPQNSIKSKKHYLAMPASTVWGTKNFFFVTAVFVSQLQSSKFI